MSYQVESNPRYVFTLGNGAEDFDYAELGFTRRAT